jgi:hypothetical protein
LIPEWCIKSVEEKYVKRLFSRNRGKVSKNAGRQGGGLKGFRGFVSGYLSGHMLFESFDGLRNVVLEYDEVGGLQVMDGLMMRISDCDVDDNKLSIRLERRCSLWSF